MKKLAWFFLFMSIFYACGSSKVLFEPVSADVQRMEENGVKTDLASLQHGYQLYSQHCSTCHGLIAPPRKSMEQWNRILPKMFPKTKLSPADQALITSYITARR